MTRISLAVLIGLLVSSTACVIAVVDRSSEGRFRSLERPFHRTVDLESGGAIVLENGDGDIEISGWEAERVDITAYRRRNLPPSAGIYFSAKRFSLPDIHAQKTGETVMIRAEGEGVGDAGTSVRYVIKVPRSVRLDRVSNVRGNILISDVFGRAVIDAAEGHIRIANFSGSLDVRLESGRIEAELLDLREGDRIRIRNEQGEIVVHLEPGVSGRFSLESPAGSIFSEIDLHHPLPAREVVSTTGEGGVSLELTAIRGDIRIRKVEE